MLSTAAIDTTAITHKPTGVIASRTGRLTARIATGSINPNILSIHGTSTMVMVIGMAHPGVRAGMVQNAIIGSTITGRIAVVIIIEELIFLAGR